jgi:hypothetical protein
MKAMKNAVHLLLLAGWTLLGTVFTLKCLGSPAGLAAGLLAAGTFWLWLVGFAALTSVLLARFTTPWAAVVVHAGTLVVLALLPHVFPVSFMRFGLDVLRSA